MKMVIQALDVSSLCQTNHFVDPFNGILITQIVVWIVFLVVFMFLLVSLGFRETLPFH